MLLVGLVRWYSELYPETYNVLHSRLLGGSVNSEGITTQVQLIILEAKQSSWSRLGSDQSVPWQAGGVSLGVFAVTMSSYIPSRRATTPAAVHLPPKI